MNEQLTLDEIQQAREVAVSVTEHGRTRFGYTTNVARDLSLSRRSVMNIYITVTGHGRPSRAV
jgi:hypothetical protein